MLGAKSPEDMIALGKKLQEQGEALKTKEAEVKQEELREDHDEALEMNDAFDKDKAHGEALEMNAEFNKDKDHEEALGINKEIDEAKAAGIRVQEKAKFAEEARLSAEADRAVAAEVLKKLQGSDTAPMPAEKTEPMNTESVAEASVEDAKDTDETLIEKIGAPDNETFKKYGSKMREAADALVSLKEKIIANDKKLKDENLEFKSAEWKILWDENEALNDQRNELLSDATRGSKAIDLDPYLRENERDAELKKYRETAMSDPYIVLHIVESGNLGYTHREKEGLGKINAELRSNPEFMSRVLDKLSSRAAEGFWAHTQGETAKDKNLYIKAVKKNHLNYQWGKPEWKSDPKIQKTALESGLSSAYLYKS